MRTVLLAGVLVGLLFFGGCNFLREELPVVAVIDTEPHPPLGDPPLSVRFSADRSFGKVVEYIWDFGDGENARGRSVEHTYLSPGNYRVILRVRGADGSEDTDEIRVHVNSQRPIINYLYAERYIVHVEHDLRFYVDAYDPDGEVRFYHWEFGDGDTAVTAATEITHVYTRPGIHEVSVQAEDDNGDLSEPLTLRIEVLPSCPCDSENG